MKTKSLVNYLFEITNLDRVPRTGYYQFLYEDFESIASHSYKVAVIAYFLAKSLGLNEERVVVIALFHDTEETRTGDSNWIQKPYLKQDEGKSFSDQTSPLSKSLISDLVLLKKEYKEKKSDEAQIVKDADYIEYFMGLKILSMKGNREADKRLEYETKTLDFMYTKLGKQVLKEVLKTDPNGWTRVNHKGTMKKYIKRANRNKKV
jgi:putative hydrolase of HD superfamily